MRLKLWSALAAVGLAVALFASAPAGAEPSTGGPVAPAGTEASPTPPPAPPVPEAVLANVASVATGYYHGCAVLVNRQVRCWGWNGDGGLGNGSPVDEFDTAVVTKNVAGNGPLQNVVQVVGGDYHSCALLTNGQVRCWGDDEVGQLGDGLPEADSTLPVVVRNATDTGPLVNVRRISAESYGACALLTNDQVRCWGEDDYGQLGNGLPEVDSDLPVAVKGLGGAGVLGNVRSLGGGYDNNCAVLNNGQARCWGLNGDASGTASSLGNGRIPNSPYPVVVKNLSGGGPLTGVTQISIGGGHGCARLGNGQARCWGINGNGQLGTGTTTNSLLPVVVKRQGGGVLTGVRNIYASEDHTCALVVGGQVRCWGNDRRAQNGDGTLEAPTYRKLPAPVRNGGNNGNLINVTQLASKSFHACVRLNTGEARCWGYGEYGGLGDGDTDDDVLPVRVLI